MCVSTTELKWQDCRQLIAFTHVASAHIDLTKGFDEYQLEIELNSPRDVNVHQNGRAPFVTVAHKGHAVN